MKRVRFLNANAVGQDIVQATASRRSLPSAVTSSSRQATTRALEPFHFLEGWTLREFAPYQSLDTVFDPNDQKIQVLLGLYDYNGSVITDCPSLISIAQIAKRNNRSLLLTELRACQRISNHPHFAL